MVSLSVCTAWVSRLVTSDKGGGKCFARVCLSVCLSVSKITQNACIDLDEMLRIDVGTWMNWLTFEPDPDYSPDAWTGLLSPISYKRCNAEFYYIGKIPRIRIGRPSLQRGLHGFKMVLFTASRRNTFVGGTCALLSALLVGLVFGLLILSLQWWHTRLAR